MPEFTQQARVVVIGGGIVGCSVAYHLAKRGWTDVVLVERDELTSGATWHAAGLVGQLRSSRNVTRMIQYSVDLYRSLEAETGLPTGWRGVGSLRIASSTARMQELRKTANTGRSFGLDVHLLSPAETQELFPIADLSSIVGAAYLESDGYADPSMLTQALAKGARDRGVKILKRTRVVGLEVRHGAVTAVETDQGAIRCDAVVNAAGMWARQLGKMAGVNVPVVPIEHQFLVTEPIAGVPESFPVTRDPDHRVYWRPEVGGLAMGGFEPNPIPWCVDGVPWDFSSSLLDPRFDHFEPLAEAAMARTPCLQTAGVKQLINGPDGYSPDGAYVLGLAPELRNFYVAAGMNCYGIAGGGGVGKVLAEWMIDGRPSLDIYALDIRRFGAPHYRSRDFVAVRSLEYYPKHYTIAWPMYSNQTARGLRRSPLYPLLRAKGAVFGEKNGWERPQWFVRDGEDAAEEMTFDCPNWDAAVGAEVRALSERVALLDQTSFGKIAVRGPGALAMLQHLAVRNVDRPPGTLIYTQMCNERGGVEADLTIARVASEEFYLVTGTAFVAQDAHWIRRHAPADGSVTVDDVTSSRVVINLGGPRARDLLRKVTDADVSNAAFPFGSCRDIHVGYAPVLALRVSYHGELGWELHTPTEYGAYLYELLSDAGAEFEVVDIGYRALESCRLEKGYLYWSADVTPDYNPFEAGLGFNVALDKGDFLGREALAAVKAAGPRQRLCLFTLDERAELFGSEPILRGDEVVGIVTSGGYGYRVDKTIALGYLPAEEAGNDTFAIAAFGKEYKAKRFFASVYDPGREKVLG